MKKYLLIALVLLLGVWLAGCSGSRVNSVDETNIPIVKPEMGDKGAANGWSDPTPGDPYNWRWCSMYGQWYNRGGANLAYNPPGYDPGYYMHYWLTSEAIADGWGLYQCHVAYWPSGTDVDDKKDGIPGKYPFKWEWTPVYDDYPPGEYYLYLGDEFDPAADTLMAIHSVIIKGYWELNYAGEWVWVETANETGWGANCGGKYGDGTWDWDGDWDKKWGGWVDSESTYNLPIFDPVLDKCYKAWHYGPYSYWRVRFTTEDWYPFPGSNDWVGWCTDPRTMSTNTEYCVDVYSCYDPDLPAYAASDNWEFIAYLINQRNKGEGIYDVDWTLQANKDHFQNAVWYFKYGPGNSMGAMPGGLGGQFVNDAKANGDNYYPMAGEWYAAILWPELSVQMNIIEVDP